MISLKNGIDKHGLEEFFSKNAIDKKDCVWIVTDRSQVKTADEVHVAAAGQMDMGTQYAFESLKEVDAQYLDKIRMRYNGIPWVIGYTKRCMIRELSLSDIRHFTIFMKSLELRISLSRYMILKKKQNIKKLYKICIRIF